MKTRSLQNINIIDVLVAARKHYDARTLQYQNPSAGRGGECLYYSETSSGKECRCVIGAAIKLKVIQSMSVGQLGSPISYIFDGYPMRLTKVKDYDEEFEELETLQRLHDDAVMFSGTHCSGEFRKYFFSLEKKYGTRK